MTVADAPRTELGYAAGIVPALGPGADGAYTIESTDWNADLRFPASAVVYDRMRREDTQVGSVLRAVCHPILSTGWDLVGDDVRPEVMAFVRSELGLDAAAGRARRRRNGIVWREHLREALLMLPFGFMPFEVVYDVGPASPGLGDGTDRLYAHLRKLGPRMPRTIDQVRVSRDGGLAGIVQAPTHDPGNVRPLGTFIPRDRLLVYVNEREGADWTGTSVLRQAYKNWLIKDALIRLGAQVVERNGMGIPFVNYTDDADAGRAQALARNLRAGATSGGALKQGMSVSLVGVTGSTADELPRVKYHDESIGRSLLAMFLNLGHDAGARSLGDTFVAQFLEFVRGIIGNVEETATENLVRDLVELNYGPDEPYPLLRARDVTEEASAESLKALSDAGLITYDLPTENFLRQKRGLPLKPEPEPGGDQAVEDAANASQVAQVGIPALIAANVITPDEGRTMLKLPGKAPIPAEATAAVPVAALSAGRDGIRGALGLSVVVLEDATPSVVERLEHVTSLLSAFEHGHGVTA